ncbi:hypothetical protein BACCIP111899_01000 [Bacillus rhizoplanae]|uniref:LXG domain-containing protein n=1 Tax=Bacillus rhizoplanae TaxID=2880966 RepID=A0ABM8Y845_9BACI|nr:T7SS effector LXG polymorphic toxin [Bacillus rhizoplanae]CAG9611828.1 hypothetical protein BACCIP111899_01000 [Bacillus rhizoplanae]
MSLNMYLGEVQAQSQSMNAFCAATIQGMEQAISSIDAFVGDAVLQGQTYNSAKTFFAQTFRPLAQGIIYLCEELIRQNNAFPNNFQSQVASTDVIEQEILAQIREIERMIATMEAMSENMPGTQTMIQIYYTMKRKLQEKLEHLYKFNYTSSSNYDTAFQLAASIAQGLAEVQSGKGFNAASGTFSNQGLNMEWTASIQKITEDKAREAEKLANLKKEPNDKTKILKGSAEGAKENRLGGKLEGTVVDATTDIGRGTAVNNKLLTGNLEANFGKNKEAIIEDIYTGGLFGFKAEASFLESNIEKEEFIGEKTTVTQKFQNVSSAFGIDEYSFKADASYTAHKYEVLLEKIDIPDIIPYFSDNDFTVRFEFGIGNVGFKLHAGAENGFYTPLYKDFAVGFFVKPEKKE